MMMETLAELGAYIRQKREALGLTLDVVSGRAHISKPYLSNIETARAPGPPSAEMLVRLEEVLGFMPKELQRAADWLRTPEAIRELVRSGRGPRRADGAVDLDQLMGKAGASRPLKDEAPAADEALRPVSAVPLINRVAAGQAAEFTDLDYPVGVADSYVPLPEQTGLSPAGTFALRVSGDSMEPEYHEGDLVIVTSTPPKEGDICLVRLGAGDNFATTLKRVEFVSGSGQDQTDAEQAEAVRLVPLNPRHTVRVVAMEEVTGIFPVQWKMTAVRPAAARAPRPIAAAPGEPERGTFDLAQD